MSIQTLYTAATGMTSMQTKLDVIANNLANINTTAFKKDRANFEDLFYRVEALPGSLDANGVPTPTGIEVGLGSRVQSTQTDYGQGDFQNTGRELDVLIEGEGFLQVQDPNSSQIVFTRAGNLNVNANGDLVAGSATTGRLIEPAINIPPDAIRVQISSTGLVQVQQPGNTALSQIGQLELATFINPDGLLKLGENLYAETDASAAPITATPGTEGLGFIRQNYLEASNVEPVQELIALITTQRAFELNSQTVQAGDQMLQLIGNLRRF